MEQYYRQEGAGTLETYDTTYQQQADVGLQQYSSTTKHSYTIRIRIVLSNAVYNHLYLSVPTRANSHLRLNYLAVLFFTFTSTQIHININLK